MFQAHTERAIPEATIQATGYHGVSKNYLAMIPEETALGKRLSNPLFQQYVDDAPEGIALLDAPCGIGLNAVTTLNLRPDFEVAVSDASDEMLSQALMNARSFGHTVNSHQAKLDELRSKSDWEGKFGLILAPNVASELFGDMPLSAYDDHLIASLEGLKSTLQEGGTILIDSRDWETTFQAQWTETSRVNTHDDVPYRAQYIWTFGQAVDAEHVADTEFWNDNDGYDQASRNIIRFAGRSQRQLEDLFNQAGLRVTETKHEVRGNHSEPFVTYALQEQRYG